MADRIYPSLSQRDAIYLQGPNGQEWKIWVDDVGALHIDPVI